MRFVISHILIEPQPLPCTQPCRYEFHAPAVHPHPTFTAPLLGSTFESCWKSLVGLFCGGNHRVKAVGCFCRRAPSLMFDCILIATASEEKVSTTRVTQEYLEPSRLLILLIHTKHKTIRRNLGLTPDLHSLEGELIRWVDEAKNV